MTRERNAMQARRRTVAGQPVTGPASGERLQRTRCGGGDLSAMNVAASRPRRIGTLVSPHGGTHTVRGYLHG